MVNYSDFVGKAKKALETARAVDDRRLSISAGNTKMGAVPSVSLLPFVTCPATCRETCAGKCYAAKIANMRPTVLTAYARNTALYLDHPAEYFEQIREYCAGARFFRWHVAGDIPDGKYFAEMVNIARACPWCRFLAFTKRVELVNAYLKAGFTLPENLKVIFSNWGAVKMENPHALPVSEVVFKGAEPAENWKICGGNCFACACRGVGCWELKTGETIAFKER